MDKILLRTEEKDITFASIKDLTEDIWCLENEDEEVVIQVKEEIAENEDTPDALLELNGKTYYANLTEVDSDEILFAMKIEEEYASEIKKLEEMASKKEVEYKVGTVTYDYQFFYHGSGMINNRTVLSAGINLGIHVFKNGKELLFEKEIPDIVIEEPSRIFGTRKRYVSAAEMFRIEIDKEEYRIVEVEEIINSFKEQGGYDEIYCLEEGYTFLLGANIPQIVEVISVSMTFWQRFVTRYNNFFEKEAVHSICLNSEVVL